MQAVSGVMISVSDDETLSLGSHGERGNHSTVCSMAFTQGSINTVLWTWSSVASATINSTRGAHKRLERQFIHLYFKVPAAYFKRCWFLFSLPNRFSVDYIGLLRNAARVSSAEPLYIHREVFGFCFMALHPGSKPLPTPAYKPILGKTFTKKNTLHNSVVSSAKAKVWQHGVLMHARQGVRAHEYSSHVTIPSVE